MPKSESSNPNEGPSFQGPRYRPNWIGALLCFLLGAFLTVALVAYAPAQSPFDFKPEPTEKNPAGLFGAYAASAMLRAVGMGTWFTPIFLFWMLIVSIRNSKHLTGTRTLAMLVATMVFTGLAAMFDEPTWSSNYFPFGHGGVVGQWLYHDFLRAALGPFGSALILGTTYLASLLFIFTRDIGAEIEKILMNFGAWRAARRQKAAAAADARRKEKDTQLKQKSAAAAVAASASRPPMPVGPTGKKTFVPAGGEDPLAKPAAARSHDAAPAEPKPVKPPAAPITAPPPAKAESKPTTPLKVGSGKGSETATDTKPLAVATGKVELNIVKPEEPKKAAKITLPQSDDANYQFPPLHLLKEQIKPAGAGGEDEHRQNAENLLRILSEFGVEVTLGEIHVGPVITRYEVVPAAGVRVEKIAGLDKNIALGMRAQSVRILAPIPGKAAVGVEVPNQHPTPVGMRELLESVDWADAKAELPIALGKDVSGKPLISDLAKMPHLLIAGATGSGKSVCINSLVASVLYSKSPKDVRLIMVDPKVLELKIFNTLPHMLIPV
ncbi:MAG TPA: DNA translocase FtsK 4TM domain-containing protein, partial [Opitutaceae bacterium]|nr:DNA translocase FtsK 4TM domain-containing protein [Opitutaceae bacterium]